MKIICLVNAVVCAMLLAAGVPRLLGVNLVWLCAAFIIGSWITWPQKS